MRLVNQETPNDAHAYLRKKQMSLNATKHVLSPYLKKVKPTEIINASVT